MVFPTKKGWFPLGPEPGNTGPPWTEPDGTRSARSAAAQYVSRLGLRQQGEALAAGAQLSSW